MIKLHALRLRGVAGVFLVLHDRSRLGWLALLIDAMNAAAMDRLLLGLHIPDLVKLHMVRIGVGASGDAAKALDPRVAFKPEPTDELWWSTT